MVNDVLKLYDVLLYHFGSQDWWPYDSKHHKLYGSDYRFEIMIGAILTQNTAWSNVEKAIDNLKKNRCLTVKSIVDIDIDLLRIMIQPSGYFNQKSNRLKILANYLYENYGCDLDRFFKRELNDLRDDLLSLNGIGPETADSIILYAGDHPIFVVDSYTKRICNRIPIKIKDDSYSKIQQYFETSISKNVSDKDVVDIYKDMHALIVELSKNYCKAKPLCKSCPINNFCSFYR